MATVTPTTAQLVTATFAPTVEVGITPTNDGKLAACMDGLAALVTAASMTDSVFASPVDSISPPAVVIGYPTTFDFDVTMGRGADEMVYPLWYVVGRSSGMQSRNALSDVMSETGTVKGILDGVHTFGAFTVSVRVTDAAITELTVAGVAYLAARFDCEVIG